MADFFLMFDPLWQPLMVSGTVVCMAIVLWMRRSWPSFVEHQKKLSERWPDEKPINSSFMWSSPAEKLEFLGWYWDRGGALFVIASGTLLLILLPLWFYPFVSPTFFRAIECYDAHGQVRVVGWRSLSQTLRDGCRWVDEGK